MGLGSQKLQGEVRHGMSALHSDGIILNPTVTLDEETIRKEGKYVYQDLVRLRKGLESGTLMIDS